MTKLFGSNAGSFYNAYNAEWPINKDGANVRETIYNLYHILNHYILFGGGYLTQAQIMIDRIVSSS